MANPTIEHIIVFLDTGLQKKFIPLRKPANYTELSKKMTIPESLQEALDTIDKYDELFSDNTKKQLDKIFSDTRKYDWYSPYSFLKTRFGKKTWHLKKGPEVTLNGIWFLVETNTSAQDGNKHQTKYDRGYFFQSNTLSEEEKKRFLADFQSKRPYSGGESHYISLQENDTLPPLGFSLLEKGKEVLIDFGCLQFVVAIRTPGGEIRDVDVILDLGNTRTAGLLFDHAGNNVFNPNNFKEQFKVLRIKPDPSSGDFESLDDVESGIVPSWILLHQIEHQSYLEKRDSKYPKYLETEYKNIEVKPFPKKLFKAQEYSVTGTVSQRIPQMFTQMSPVLLGDQAERFFNLPYARAMIAVGAKLQQSSPKRYYWDDEKGDVWWNMLLNEWDKAYNDTPQDATSLPILQGEMLRFTPEDGSILDLSIEREPAKTPNAYPEKPAYPRQSTLTWFLLHVLERAYSQANAAFAKGAEFIPHRLRKVLITYPSGWTQDEVLRYRERCQEALNIFSQANIYHGVKSPFRLEMIPSEQTPDEAVAGQLPFVFSEIIRYPGQTAAKWISLVGKNRCGENSVRIMNFDIGGGTTDISIIEYKDLNPADVGMAQNLLSTNLLFKDGQATAGDDLIKSIIENIILGGLIRTKNMINGLSASIIRNFTQSFTDKDKKAIRCRIIRTTLIPLATMCLAKLGESSSQFSAQQAGVNQNNWREFLEFLGLPGDAIPFTQECFSFTSSEINELIEMQFKGLFQNCSMYAAAYDVDFLIFSGKPSELPYIRTMAKHYIPIDDNRIIFAKDFKAGQWYPFTDDNGYIKDAKTVTVVGSALYYALSNGLIAGWKIESAKTVPNRNEWGQLASMRSVDRAVFLKNDQDTTEITMLPNTIIARRQNICSAPEPVYKFIRKGSAENVSFRVRLKRKTNEDGESLFIDSIDGKKDNIKDFELKLWPCENEIGAGFWQESGIFENIEY